MPTYHIQTHGCQMNYSDTERMEAYLEALGFTKAAFDEADLLMFNTCSIKQKAEDKVFGTLKQVSDMKRRHKNLKVAITGCMVRKSSSRYSTTRDRLFFRSQEIDIALRTEELPKLASLLREIDPDSKIKSIKEEGLEDYFQIQPNYASNAQAFVAVSTGCDKFCTYCIVPFSRGREKSRTLTDILNECKALVESGCKEITLIGQTVNSYGLSVHDRMEKKFADLPKGKEPFVYLLEQLDKLHAKGLERVRFTSPHPKDMSDRLIDAMATLKTQMPYLHLPVQSGDNRVLKRMNRTYTIEKYRALVKKIRARIPDISISTDIIIGFSGESDEEFESTYKFFKEMNFEHAYLSEYSQRRGTYAAKNIKDDVPAGIKNKRWHKLNNLLKKLSAKALSRFVGMTVPVLVEHQEGARCLGRSPHFKRVSFNSKKNLLGQIVPIKITKSLLWDLEGKLV
ncbi:MAG: tRNA (N6-isopentenyl adenosine(37)-C2)-methylthiotransferase MiaB [Candidatus Gracilibacteria bacterium]